MQLAQLEELQEEQPDDIERVLPSLDRDTPLKLENSLSTLVELQSGQLTPSSDPPKTIFSNSDSHFRHLYSKIGMITSTKTQLNSRYYHNPRSYAFTALPVSGGGR